MKEQETFYASLENAPGCVDSLEYAQYTNNVEHTLKQLRVDLAGCSNPQQLALRLMKIALEFYDADWCGIIDADVNLKIWSPFWWYDAEHGEMAPKLPAEMSSFETYDSWIECLRDDKDMIIPDTEELKETHPDEYEFYQSIGAKSVLAVSFWKRPKGFFVLRNPKRYKTFTTILRLLNYITVTTLNEYYLMETNKRSMKSPQIVKDNDVYISVFGELKITTTQGVLTETDLKSPKISRMLVYLLLSKKRAVTPREIAEALWQDEETDTPGKNMKGLVYRLQQMFGLISDYRLIESTAYGYRMNPELNIITDIRLFSDKCKAALSTASVNKKKDLLRKAVDLYQGDLLVSASSEHWIMPAAINFQCYYVGMLNELMQLFNKERNYQCIHNYAAKALAIVPDNADMYYWLIHSMYLQGNCELARSELKMAQNRLLAEDYQDLIMRLSDETKREQLTRNTFITPRETGENLKFSITLSNDR